MISKHISTNGITLHVVQAGPENGPLVILLHGFPEFWYGWRSQISALARKGFRVWAPDQRGYNRSSKPEGIASYTIDQLALDIPGLMDAAGREKAFLVGHDWGAAAAWWLAGKHPERIERLVIINVPHPTVMRKHAVRSVRQMLKSWYILFFQIPRLPEALSRLGNWRMPARALQSTSRPGTFSEQDLRRYRQAWSQPGAYSAMLNWYRAAVQKSTSQPASRIIVPTLVIWGKQDRFLEPEMARASVEMCEDGRLEMFEKATHWVHHEKADQVNELIDEFLKEPSGPTF